MNRVILHSDANSFYASVECLYHPEIRSYPVAVCGDPEARHGIVLTANRAAKQSGIHVGMAVWQAKQCCKDLIAVPPHYDLYMHFSKQLREIYGEYSDRVESFGLDECWLDVSQSERDVRQSRLLADEIRTRVREELGITVSIGVSDNKIFAKLGSDMKKPDATTVLPPEDMKHVIWPLPASDLLFVGTHTTAKLRAANIRTIGDLALSDPVCLQKKLGKTGLMLREYALGHDRSPVMPAVDSLPVKSVGNSSTPPHDICDMDDARCLIYLLSESVASRLRDNAYRASCVTLWVRDTDLHGYTRQCRLPIPSCDCGEIARTVIALFTQCASEHFPYRSLGVQCSDLTPLHDLYQCSFLEDPLRREKQDRLNQTLDSLWRRYGNRSVRRGIVLMDSRYAADDPKGEHVIHPVPFYAG